MPSSHAQLAAFAATLATLHFKRRLGAAAAIEVVGNKTGRTSRHGFMASMRMMDPLGTWLVGMTWLAAVAVGVSRVYLGYHSIVQVDPNPKP